MYNKRYQVKLLDNYTNSALLADVLKRTGGNHYHT